MPKIKDPLSMDVEGMLKLQKLATANSKGIMEPKRGVPKPAATANKKKKK